jgi:hypothetical protein
MRTLKPISFVASIILLFNCENNRNTNQFLVNIDTVIQNTDSINVYYTESKSMSFTDAQSFWTKVTGNKKNQNIKIVFPDSILLKQIRLDFGRNISQNDMVLNKIDFTFKNNDFSLKGKEIFYIYRADEKNTTFGKLNGSIKRKTPKQINGSSIYPKGDNLFNKLNRFTHKNKC